MESSQDFITLFLNETGELFYFIIIFMIYQAALLMSLDQKRRSKKEVAASRYVVGLAVAVIAWLALMGGALINVISDNTVTDILPPLENAVGAIIIVALSFGLLFAEQEDGNIQNAYGVMGILIGLLMIGFLVTTQLWDTDAAFYNQVQGLSWTFIALILTGTSIYLLTSYYASGADIPLKLLFLGIVFTGQVITLIQIFSDDLNRDSSGAVRWSFVLSGLLLVVIIYRMVMDRMTYTIEEVASYAETISKPLQTIAPVAEVDQTIHKISENLSAATAGVSSIGGRNEALEILKALGTMLDKEDTNALPYQVVQAVAEMLKADIVVMLSYTDSSTWADIVAAYDFGRKQPIAGMSINLDSQPTLHLALDQKSTQTISPDDKLEELKDLYTRFDMSIQGIVYIQPMTRQGKVTGALLVGFPYQQRILRNHEIRLMESIGPIAARLTVISRTARIERVQAEENAILQLVEGFEQSGTESDGNETFAILAMRKEMQANLESAEDEINELTLHIQQLEGDLSEERQRLHTLLGDTEDEESLSVTQRIEAISVERVSLQEERTKLVQALKQAQNTLIQTVAGDSTEVYDQMNTQLQQELQDLRAQRDRLQQQLQDLHKNQAATPTQAEALLQALTEEQKALKNNKAELQRRLDDTQATLTDIGLEDTRSLLDRLGTVSRERDEYKQRATKAIQERNILIRERRKIEAAIKQENERAARIQGLEDQVLHLTQDREALAKQRDELQSEFQNMYKQVERLSQDNESLKHERDESLDILGQTNASRERLATERNEAIAERNVLFAETEKLKHERDVLLARVEGNRERLQEIEDAGVQPLSTMVDELSQQRMELENQLAQMTQKMETMRQELNAYRKANADITPSSLQVDLDVMVSLAQELRSPLSVIMGYTDTVLSESVGILGALQRKLLTRVKANVDRLAFLVEELVQIAAIDAGELKIDPHKINLTDIIDETLSSSRYKFGEKGIVIDLDLGDDELWLQADEDAIQQIVNNMIQNAYVVAPTESTVHIHASMQEHFQREAAPRLDIENAILFQIRDEGGGIRPEDQARVFTRLYRAENPLIEGLGDTGVGMSITKALIEAHGGYIWLDSNIGTGNTFTFVIPTEQPILQVNLDNISDDTLTST